ncbi:MAG: hypothetical protein NXI32_06375 [bacterium]|nr:hypothetical protein [bacterium]
MIDLYRLLELQPLEADDARIQAALNRCRLLAEKGGDAKFRKRAARLYELGRSHLLSQQKKAEYDLKWKAVFGRQSSQADMPAGDSETADALKTHLPDGDPNQAFDLAAYLESSADFSPLPIDDEFDELMAFLQPSNPAERLGDQQLQTAVMTKAPRTAVEPTYLGAGEKRSRTPVTSRPAATSLAGSLRKKRDHSLLMIAGGLLLSVAVVLAVVLVVTRVGRQPPAVAALPDPQDVVDATPSQEVTPQESALKRPVGSGLPQLKIPTEQGDPVSENPLTTSMPSDPGGFEASGKTSSQAATPTDADAAMNDQNKTLDPPAASEPTLSPEENQAWQAALRKVHQAIVGWQWEDAPLQLSELNAIAQTSSQRQQMLAMQSALELTQRAHEALLEAIDSLAAGDVLKVRSNQLSFVEGDGEKVVFRIEGRNQRFPLRELPIGILESLLDLKLDSINERAQAQKAALVLIHPKASELVIPRARNALEKAEQNERIAAGTLAILAGEFER